MTKKTENRGGKREGAGRKPIFEFGEAQRREIIEDVAAVAKKNKTSFGKTLGNMMFGPKGESRTRLQSMKLFATDILPKVSERDVTITKVKLPQVFIPEQLPDTEDAQPYESETNESLH